MPHELGLFPPSWLQLFSANVLQASSNTSWPANELFISFEDALWNYLNRNPLKNKAILVPDFFCTDVTSRLEERGFNIIWYSLNIDLTFSEEQFLSSFSSENIKASVGALFIYYPLGNRDGVPACSWFRAQLGDSVLLIEDCADCLLEPQQVLLLDENHIIIDSLRKILPMQGARLFSLRASVYQISPLSLFNSYFLKTGVLHFLYSFIHIITEFFPLKLLLQWKWALFGMHSDSIGTNYQGIRKGLFSPYLLSCISIHKFKEKRQQVVTWYQENVSDIEIKTNFHIIPFPHNQGEARFIVLSGEKGSLLTIADQLEKKSVFVDIHFDDSPRAINTDYLLLPIQLTMTKKEVDFICNAIIELAN